MAHVSNIPHTGFNLGARIRAFVEDVKQARARAAEYNRTYAELQGLTDRELNDIGVRRCDIADLARAHVYCD
ncbi:DUF1127 domain-containing protein [Ruegeria sediminis]|uniref:DUF1127 domain-containing protein n=1 Tax=Ruegeria sediminis TaxID=2583820 RepID=A0ABY2WSC3_9RHOB|nr:DUF1127 domain-containing protein [Ruegeria sediminis]TMV03297.1 DUF1127 domain-containing protein [Ruegeria sediminis]